MKHWEFHMRSHDRIDTQESPVSNLQFWVTVALFVFLVVVI